MSDFIKEGTWALSKSPEKRQEEGAFWIAQIQELKDGIYNVFGDDILFDHFDHAIKRIEEMMAIPEEEISEGLNEDVTIPANLTQQYLVVKKQIADKQTQKDQLMKQVNQKDNEINILTKNLIAIEAKAAQEQGKEAAIKTGETAQPENKTEATSTSSNESLVSISDLMTEINEMEGWLAEMGAEEFEEEGGEIAGEVLDVEEFEDDEEGPAEQDKEDVFAIRISDPDEDEEIIAKVYKNEDNDFWKIRVVQGSEDPLETMQFDPDMEFLDIIEKLGEIYDEVEELSMEEYKELLDDKAEQDAKYDWEEGPEAKELKEQAIMKKIYYSDNTPEYVKKEAQNQFSDLLPGGCYFTIGTTPGGRKRLQIKCDGKLAFEFNAGIRRGIPQRRELTINDVKHAVDYINQYFFKNE